MAIFKVAFNCKKPSEPILEEYKALRMEIINHQSSRIKILQFTIAALGAIIGVLGFFLRFNASNNQSIDLGLISNFILIFSIFAMIIVLSSLILTMKKTQQINIIGSYIKKYIEPELNLNWEKRWDKYRNMKFKWPKNIYLPGGTSRSLALFYILLTLPFLFLVCFFVNPVTNEERFLKYLFFGITILSVILASASFFKQVMGADWTGIE